MNAQHQQHFQVSAQQLQAQMQQFTPQFPPPMPQMQLPPYLQQAAAQILIDIVNTIQANAQKNPLRVYAFNLWAQNGYANEKFLGLAIAVFEWIEAGLETRQFQNLQQAVAEVVPSMVEMATCAQLRNNQGLNQFIDDMTRQQAWNVIRAFDTLAAQIAQFKNMRMQQAAPYGQYGQPAPQSMNTGYGAAVSSGNVSMFSGQSAPAVASYGEARRQSSQAQESSPSFNRFSRVRVSSAQEDTQQCTSENTGVQSVRVSPGQFSQPEIQPHQQLGKLPTEGVTSVPGAQTLSELATGMPLISGGKLELADESSLVWMPTPQQPYRGTYNPIRQLLYLKQLDDGSVIEVVQERSRDSVDYDKHKLVYAFGPAARRLDPMRTLNQLDQLEAACVPIDEEDPLLTEEDRARLGDRVFDESWVSIDTSLESSWIVADLSRWKHVTNGKFPMIYHRRARLANPVVCKADERDYIVALGKCKSYSELRMKLLELSERMSPALWSYCERRATDLVNRVLAQGLAIDTLSIDSFVEDINELLPVLKKRYGEGFLQAFLDNQKWSIQKTFLAFDIEEPSQAEQETVLNEDFLREFSEQASDMPKLTYLVHDVTLTFVNVLSQELGMELAKGNRATLVTTKTPFMLALCNDILSEVVGDHVFDRHYIRTQDGRVLELTEGLVGEDSCLVKLVR